MHPNDTYECFAHHMGLWALEPTRLRHLVWMAQQGLYPERLRAWADERQPRAAIEQPRFIRGDNGVAIIRLIGPMSKGVSKFTDTSTIQVRQALRAAVSDEQVRSVMLVIDSPGGMVAGTAELADAVRKADATKPVTAYIEDLGASAAYWVASQARRITSNRIAEIGSIGVLAVVQDTSKLAEREGVQVHVIATGPYKGAGVPGTPILPEQLQDMESRVNTVATHFFAAVRGGRDLTSAQMSRVTDGRVFPAAEAQALGLIDGIETFDEAFAATAGMPAKRRRGQQRAEHTAARAFWET